MGSNVIQPNQLIDSQIVEGGKCISEFSEEWDDLFDRAVDAPPFLSRPWISTFIQEGELRGKPLFLLAWCGPRLVGLFPLAVRELLNARIAEPIGAGEGSYLGLLLDPNYPSVVECIAELFNREAVADALLIEDLSSDDGATKELLDRLSRNKFLCLRCHRDICHWIKLGCSFNEYLQRKTTKGRRRYKLRYKERRLFGSGDVRVVRYAGKDITPEVNTRVAVIQSESWMKRRGAAVLGEPLYQRLLTNMAEAGSGRVWLMTIDGDDAAFAYTFVAHGRLHYIWPAFKLKYESAFSVGQMLLMQIIRDACDEGIVAFDFGYGDAEYKRFWSTNNRSVYRVVAGRGPVGRLLAVSYFVLWRLSRIRYLRWSYHRIKRILHSLKQKTVSFSARVILNWL